MTKSGTSDFPFTIQISPYPTGQPARLEECFQKKISSSPKMTSVQGCGRPRWERPSIAPSVAPSIAPLDSFPPPESGDELSDQPARPSRRKPLANSSPAATSIPKYSKDDLQRIFKAVLEA